MNDIISQLVVKRVLTIETSLADYTGGKAEIKFKSGQVGKLLDGQLCYGYEFLTATNQALTSTGRAVAPQANAPNILLSLVEAQTEDVFWNKNVVTRLQPTLYNGYTQFFEPRVINWTNSSYIITQTGGLTALMSLLLLVFWKKPGE